MSLAFAGQERGTYVDVGGGHPIAGSVSFWFYERGWQGIVVEPQGALAALHRKLRPRDTLVSSVVGRDADSIEFHQVDRFHALSSTLKDNAEAAAKYGARYSTLRLPSISLAELCRRHTLEKIDFLKIDVEGAEYEVVNGADWRRYRPGIVVIESVTPDTNEPSWHSWEPILLSHGYRFVMFDSLNRFYVAEERRDLLARMPRTRAPWDSALHMYEVGRAPENNNHPDHLLAKRLVHGLLANLPHLSDDVIESALNHVSYRFGEADISGTSPVDQEAFRLSLGRIASAYDGGHLDDD